MSAESMLVAREIARWRSARPHAADPGEREPEMSTMRRRCRTPRPSQRRGTYEHTLSQPGWYPFRCHECRTRFFVRVERDSALLWRALQCACLAGAFVVGAMVALGPGPDNRGEGRPQRSGATAPSNSFRLVTVVPDPNTPACRTPTPGTTREEILRELESLLDSNGIPTTFDPVQVALSLDVQLLDGRTVVWGTDDP